MNNNVLNVFIGYELLANKPKLNT